MITGLTKLEWFIANHIFVFGPEGATYYDGTIVEWSATIGIIKTILLATAILAIIGVVILIRQQKILRKLDELTKKTEEPTTEDKP